MTPLSSTKALGGPPQGLTLLRSDAAATYIRERWNFQCQPSTLDAYASRGDGPLFHKVGRVRLYDPPDIDAWAIERLSQPVRSTAELPRTAVKAPKRQRVLDVAARRLRCGKRVEHLAEAADRHNGSCVNPESDGAT